jgi:anthranilate synthase component 2
MLLMIDNYDSFTFNLVQYFGELGQEVRTVFRNDEITLAGIAALKPDHAGAVARALHAGRGRHLRRGHPPLHGQAAAAGRVPGPPGHRRGAGRQGRARQVQMHGKASTHLHRRRGRLPRLPQHFSVIRYHSLAIERESLPAVLEVTATSEDGEIMGVRHRDLAGTATPLEGVQFHPESILSEHGHAMLKNFLQMG